MKFVKEAPELRIEDGLTFTGTSTKETVASKLILKSREAKYSAKKFLPYPPTKFTKSVNKPHCHKIFPPVPLSKSYNVYQ